MRWEAGLGGRAGRRAAEAGGRAGSVLWRRGGDFDGCEKKERDERKLLGAAERAARRDARGPRTGEFSGCTRPGSVAKLDPSFSTGQGSEHVFV